MCGKSLVLNLVAYLDTLTTTPVYAFDLNESREMPCIIVGYSGESMSFPGGYGHYTIEGSIFVCVQGYDDPTNTSGDALADLVFEAVDTNDADMYAAINKPAGTDLRPSKDFHCHRLFVRGVERTSDGTSEEIEIRFTAFCVKRDK